MGTEPARAAHRAGPQRLESVAVVGAGLIGTSLAMRLGDRGVQVWVQDADAATESLAAGLAGSHAGTPPHQVDLLVAAVPPAAIPTELKRLARLNVARTYTHVGSVLTDCEAEVETEASLRERFVGGHPVAGRERSGPQSASADLFDDRPWVVSPTPSSAADAVEDVIDLATTCGAVPTVLDAREHDSVMARLSHLPQLVASALAAQLRDLPQDRLPLAGSGLRDTTRLADSDPALWGEIIGLNAGPVAGALQALLDALQPLAGALASGSEVRPAVAALVDAGRKGRTGLTVKHGTAAGPWATVAVVLDDRPGALARLLTEVATVGVNVEDLRLEHSAGFPRGMALLDVRPEEAGRAAAALHEAGWSAHALD